jgi:hypothetical protein
MRAVAAVSSVRAARRGPRGPGGARSRAGRRPGRASSTWSDATTVIPSSWLIRRRNSITVWASAGVEARHRFVGQDHRRLLEQRPGDGHALAGRPRACPPGGRRGPSRPTRVEDGVGLSRPSAANQPIGTASGRRASPPSRGILEHGQPALEVELLEHEADARPHAPQRLGRSAGHRLVPIRTSRRSGSRGRSSSARGWISRPARPDEGHELTRRDVRSTPSSAREPG